MIINWTVIRQELLLAGMVIFRCFWILLFAPIAVIWIWVAFFTYDITEDYDRWMRLMIWCWTFGKIGVRVTNKTWQ